MDLFTFIKLTKLHSRLFCRLTSHTIQALQSTSWSIENPQTAKLQLRGAQSHRCLAQVTKQETCVSSKDVSKKHHEYHRKATRLMEGTSIQKFLRSDSLITSAPSLGAKACTEKRIDQQRSHCSRAATDDKWFTERLVIHIYDIYEHYITIFIQIISYTGTVGWQWVETHRSHPLWG